MERLPMLELIAPKGGHGDDMNVEGGEISAGNGDGEILREEGFLTLGRHRRHRRPRHGLSVPQTFDAPSLLVTLQRGEPSWARIALGLAARRPPFLFV
jgi:hypothetical protein